MTPQNARPDPDGCQEKQELVEAIRAATDQIVALSQYGTQPGSKPDAKESERIQRQLNQAKELRASLLEKYNTHVEAHGCK